MSQSAALFAFVVYIAWLLVRDVKRREGISVHLWGVVCWVALIGSRPVSTWFSHGVDFGGVAQGYDDGNPIERMAYFALMLHAGWVLLHRRVSLGTFIRANGWLTVFVLYCAASVLWADLPFVAFKRWIKDLGNVLMVLVILTERNPIEAAKAVFVRCAAVLLPLSLLFIRFYGDLGRTYHVASGEMMYTGITNHKNSLGLLVLVCGMFLLWDFFASRRDQARPRSTIGMLVDASLVLMAAALLVQANSATALVCGVIGAAVFVALGSESVRRNIRGYEVGALVLAVLAWTVNSSFDVVRFVVVDLLGRDLTLTTRTDVWPMLLAMNDSVLFGAGFNSFWSGARLEFLYAQLSIIQAHNGYLETYLNGGLVGLTLLGMLLLSAARSINRDVVAAEPFAVVRFAFFLIVVVNNLTEASFSKMSILWFAFLLVAVRYPARTVSVPGDRPKPWQLSRSPTGRRSPPTSSGGAGVPGRRTGRRGKLR